MSLPEKPEIAPAAQSSPESSSSRTGTPNSPDSDLQRTQTSNSVWPIETMSRPRTFLFVAVCCLTQFCTQAAFMDTLIQLTPIGNAFHVAHPGDLAWLVAGFSLTVGTFIMFSGRLGDVFGHARMVLIGLVWFSLCSLLAGIASYSTFEFFVFCRVIQGIGPAICLPNALALLGSAYPPEDKRKAMSFALFGGSAPTGAMAGALFAGMFNKVATWEWTYYSMAIALALITVVAYFVLPRDHPGHHVTRKNMVAELDLLGAFVGITALILFNFAWNQAPIVGWQTAEVIAPLIIGVIMFIGFVYIEMHVSTNPLVPLDVLTNRDVLFVLAAVMFGWGTFGVWSLYTVQILQNIRGLSPMTTVLYFLPVAPAGLIAAIVTGIFLGTFKMPPPVVMLIALVAFTTGTTLVATADMDQIYWGQIFVSMLIIPFGMDMSFPAATLIMSNAVSRKHQGIAASLVNTVVNYGISLGVAYAGTVEVHLNNGGETKADLLKGYHAAFYLGIGLSVLGICVCLTFLGLYLRDLRRMSNNSDDEIEVAEQDEEKKESV